MKEKKYGKDFGLRDIKACARYFNDNGYRSLGNIVIGIDKNSDDKNMLVVFKDNTLEYVSDYKTLKIIEEKTKLEWWD